MYSLQELVRLELEHKLKKSSPGKWASRKLSAEQKNCMSSYLTFYSYLSSQQTLQMILRRDSTFLILCLRHLILK